MDSIDPFAVNRELKRCAERWRAYRRALGRGESYAGDPFQASRWVCGRTGFERLAELKQDPVAPVLQRWVYRLTTERVNRELITALAERRRTETHWLDEPERGRFSLDVMLKRALAEPDTRPYWLTGLLAHAGRTHEASALLWERRQEIALGFKLGSPDDIEAPADDLYLEAERWLAHTDELWPAAQHIEPSQLIERALAHAARLDFPSHLTPRSLLSFFADTRLFESLDLNPGELPDGVAPASYLRALARLGSAFLDANAPKDQPFAVAHDPYGLDRRRAGALFALLLLQPEFLKRKLGATKDRSRTALRSIGESVLIESRLAAVRVLLRRAAHQGARTLRETYEDLTRRTLRLELPGSLAGVLITLHDDDLQRFAGLALGAKSSRALIESHDEDWFRNPRAVDQLRSETNLPPRATANKEELAAGYSNLYSWLASALA